MGKSAEQYTEDVYQLLANQIKSEEDGSVAWSGMLVSGQVIVPSGQFAILNPVSIAPGQEVGISGDVSIASGQAPIPTNIQQINNQSLSGSTLPTELPVDAVGHGNRTPNGSAVTLSATSVSAKYVYIKASSANTGNITVGGSAVDATVGYELEPGDGISMPVPGNDLQNIYIYGAAGSDKVQFLKLD